MKQLILASGSPRRKVILEAMGLEFDVVPSDFEEYLDDKRSPEEIALELGFGKAETVAEKYPDAYVVGGDLIIECDGVQLGKPEDAVEAKKWLQMLSGRSHQAMSSVVLVSKNNKVHEGSVAIVNVTFKDVPEDIIDAYIATGDPFDKAGGYARRHPLLNQYISIRGEANALTGIPTARLRKMLEKHGFTVPNDESTIKKLLDEGNLAVMKILI